MEEGWVSPSTAPSQVLSPLAVILQASLRQSTRASRREEASLFWAPLASY